MEFYKYLLICFLAIIGYCNATCSETLWNASDGEAVKYCRDSVKNAIENCCSVNGPCRRIYNEYDETCDIVGKVQADRYGAKTHIVNYLRNDRCNRAQNVYFWNYTF